MLPIPTLSLHMSRDDMISIIELQYSGSPSSRSTYILLTFSTSCFDAAVVKRLNHYEIRRIVAPGGFISPLALTSERYHS